jgi:hypothetical protein
MRLKGSTWSFVVAILLAVMAAAAVLPGCGDDSGGYDSDTSVPS